MVMGVRILLQAREREGGECIDRMKRKKKIRKLETTSGSPANTLLYSKAR